MPRVGKYFSSEDHPQKPQSPVKYSKSAQKEKKHSCFWCQKSFSSHSNLERHQREVQYCKRKRLEIQSEGSTATPVKIVFRKKGKKSRETCAECGKSYSSQKSLKIHMESAHLGITYPCHICEKDFNQKSNLARHLLTESHILEVLKGEKWLHNENKKIDSFIICYA